MRRTVASAALGLVLAGCAPTGRNLSSAPGGSEAAAARSEAAAAALEETAARVERLADALEADAEAAARRAGAKR